MMRMPGIILLALLVLISDVRAQNDLAILTHEEPPFVFRDQTDQLTGYAVELVGGIQTHLGSHQPVLLNPWARAYMRATEQGRVVLFPLVRNEEREALFHWLMPLTRNLHAVFANGSPGKIAALEQLEQFTAVGVQRGDFRESLLIDAGLKNLVSYTTWRQAVTALTKGRIDALFFSAAGLDYYCGQLKRDCSSYTSIYTHNIETTYIALSRLGVDEQEAERWQQATEAFRDSAMFTQMRNSWLKRIRSEYGLTLHYADSALNLWALPKTVHP
ncbi:substrate-binding periplasmic protein [Lacimicrobium alkaliphilum]|uniref:ABC transporter substrate-binding protein n=1 Tax=Lacimicrobium alkaliphilum TaxID=1526571 RepID=A0ABQ1QXY4_9ALTE|nr:transporter substrate-binding domain-containing protein [Lacimicrobium alkaliphilum]GGD48987.1 ABC transporter substrate-binding protein [Lacimicrobium alkaliphilum]